MHGRIGIKIEKKLEECLHCDDVTLRTLCSGPMLYALGFVEKKEEPRPRGLESHRFQGVTRR